MDFNDVLDKSKQKPTIVQFTAAWCGPCRIMKPAMKDVQQSRDDLNVVFVDVDKDVGPDVLIKYQVRGIPTVYLMVDGKVISQYKGWPSKPGIEKWLNNTLVKQ